MLRQCSAFMSCFSSSYCKVTWDCRNVHKLCAKIFSTVCLLLSFKYFYITHCFRAPRPWTQLQLEIGSTVWFSWELPTKNILSPNLMMLATRWTLEYERHRSLAANGKRHLKCLSTQIIVDFRPEFKTKAPDLRTMLLWSCLVVFCRRRYDCDWMGSLCLDVLLMIANALFRALGGKA